MKRCKLCGEYTNRDSGFCCLCQDKRAIDIMNILYSEEMKDKRRKARVPCACCGIEIYNKLRHAKYCIYCRQKIDKIKTLAHSRLSGLRKEFKDYKIKLILRITKP